MSEDKYKINIHAHTLFSDGRNSPLAMAIEAKRLGFTALVVTDHYYGGNHPYREITAEKWMSYTKALREAQGVLPVIRGLEVAYGGEEFLLFGSSAIKWLVHTHGIHTKLDIIQMRKDHYCAMILCHPMRSHENFAELLDGYERHNSGQDWFKNGRALGCLDGKQAWHNSDAHNVDTLARGYNIVSKKITTEDHLIAYIKSGKAVECYLQREEG